MTFSIKIKSWIKRCVCCYPNISAPAPMLGMELRSQSPKDILFFAVLGFELRASHMLSRCSTTWVNLPVLFCVGYVRDREDLKNYLPRLALNHDPLDLFLLGS
jgi:hypothetical protein